MNSHSNYKPPTSSSVFPLNIVSPPSYVSTMTGDDEVPKKLQDVGTETCTEPVNQNVVAPPKMEKVLGNSSAIEGGHLVFVKELFTDATLQSFPAPLSQQSGSVAISPPLLLPPPPLPLKPPDREVFTYPDLSNSYHLTPPPSLLQSRLMPSPRPPNSTNDSGVSTMPPPKPKPPDSCYFKRQNAPYLMAPFSRKLAAFFPPPPPPPPKPPDNSEKTIARPPPPLPEPPDRVSLSLFPSSSELPNRDVFAIPSLQRSPPCDVLQALASSSKFLSKVRSPPLDPNEIAEVKSLPLEESSKAMHCFQPIIWCHVLSFIECTTHQLLSIPPKSNDSARQLSHGCGNSLITFILPIFPTNLQSTTHEKLPLPIVEPRKSNETFFVAAIVGKVFKNAQSFSSIQEWNPGESFLMHVVAKFTRFKQWDPGENFFNTMARSRQFKQWDPGIKVF